MQLPANSALGASKRCLLPRQVGVEDPESGQLVGEQALVAIVGRQAAGVEAVSGHHVVDEADLAAARDFRTLSSQAAEATLVVRYQSGRVSNTHYGTQSHS